MDTLSGLSLKGLAYDLDGYTVYHALHADGGRRCLAKTPGEKFPALSEVQRLDRELHILSEDGDAPTGTLRPLFRVDGDRTSYLVLDDFAGRPLTLPECRNLSIPDVLTLARTMASIVAGCHARKIAHHRLSPSAVLWDRATGDMRLTHFGHAVRIGGGVTAPPAGVTPWSAPEQTGRLNVLPDERADLYALGNIIYFLLCGSVPFEGLQQHDLVHRLIASEVPPLRLRRPDAPLALSELLERLLAKNPEEREQGARAVAGELEELRLTLEAAPVRSRSRPPPLGAPTVLARSTQLEVLVQATQEVADGASRLVQLSGAAGTGKSTLIRELRRSLGQQGPLLLVGKFEQYETSVPYGALLMALRNFTERLLAGPLLALQKWQARFSHVDAALRPVLVEQLPMLEVLLGAPAAVQRLPPAETENRFHNAFHAFFDVLCTKENPVALILDDVQWADSASTKLIRQLFIDQSRSCLMLVLAHRAADETSSPEIGQLLAGLPTAGAIQLEVRELTAASVQEMCAAIVPDCRDGNALAQLVFKRSRGNPLFAIELIRALRRAGGIEWSRTDTGGYAWTYVSDVPDALPIPDDVIALIIRRVHSLPEDAQAVLKVAACFGGPVSPSLLAAVTGQSEPELRKCLDLLHAEALLTDGRRSSKGPSARAGWTELDLRFVHDRVEQATRTLCDAAELQPLHARIGWALWAAAGQPRGDEAFAIVGHLNRVAPSLDFDQRARLAELNLVAADAARASIAYANALAFTRAALELLPPHADSGLRFSLRLRMGEYRYLCADFAEAEEIFDNLLTAAQTSEQRVDVRRTRLVLYLHLQRYADAIQVAIEALRELGLRLAKAPSVVRLVGTGVSLLWKLRGLPVQRLIDARDTTAARERRILELLILLWTPAFWINQALNGLVGLTLMRLTLRYGTTSESAMALACYAVFNHMVLKRYEDAIMYAGLAQKVALAKRNPFVAGRVEFITLTFFGPFARSNRENVERYKQALALCMQDGEHVFAGCCIDGISSSLPISGFRLSEIRADLDYCATLASRIGSKGSSVLVGMVRVWCDLMSQGHKADLGALVNGKSEHAAYTGVFDLLRTSFDYLCGDDCSALALCRSLRGNQIVQSNPCHAALFDLVFVLASCRQAALAGKRMRMGRYVRRSVRRLARFAKICPKNFNASLALAQAEVARANGNFGAAIDSYRNGMGEAVAFDHYFVHGVCAERLASLYHEQGERQAYEEYLRVAVYSYGRWGASAKVEQLSAAHAGLASLREQAAEAPPLPSQALDAEAVMRASYAIAEEVRSDRLTDRLLTVLTTTAGAQRGFLIKQRDQALWIMARWDIEDKHSKSNVELLEGTKLLSEPIVRFVARSLETVHLSDASAPSSFQDDAYICSRRPRSILCVPLMIRGTLLAVMYLENDVTAGAFGERQRRLVTMLGHQAAIALSNADYHKLQIEAVQAKVNPHFLYNALSAIAGVVMADPQKADTALVKLAQLYRYMLTSSTDCTVGLDEELRITQDYLALETLRYGANLQCKVQVVGDPKRLRVPPLILQPLVENAVKHGIAPKEGGGEIRLYVEIAETQCTIRVSDDGLGWGHGEPGTGIGLSTIRERLSLAYGSDQRLVIEHGKGVQITMTLPVDQRTPYGGASPVTDDW
jgi:predicted ATPase/GAF domain-containing protein